MFIFIFSSRTFFVVLFHLLITPWAYSIDLMNGLMYAVPVKDEIPPSIDGRLSDWDLTAIEPVWISDETIRKMNIQFGLMYDREALYISAIVAMPDRSIHNINDPADAFWWGDILEFRLASDPSLPYPLSKDSSAVTKSKQIAHLSMWKNSQSGSDFLHVAFGADFNKGKIVNPPGSRLVIKEGKNQYILEAKIPWTVLGVPDGKNPFSPGQKMTAFITPHWGGDRQVPALYRINPGSFGFQNPQTWGQVEFSATGNLPPRHLSLEETIRQLALNSKKTANTGVPIKLTLPDSGKLSVNIFGTKGEVIRELIGGEFHQKGNAVFYWDGRDQWGAPMPVGSYKWGAYLSHGLKAEYRGSVGISGNPPYETEDNKGGWGGDHGFPIDISADTTGFYFLWTLAEAGRAVVKTDFQGNVVWRKTPFVGGGFGPHYAIASSGKYVFLTFEDDYLHILRLDPATGQLLPFSGQETMSRIAAGNSSTPADKKHAKEKNGSFDKYPLLGRGDLPPVGAGLAATGKEVFVSSYTDDKIYVIDPLTGKKIRTLSCTSPRGLTIDNHNNLYVISAPIGKSATVLRFDRLTGTGKIIIRKDLVYPWDIAVNRNGKIFISNLGSSQQVKLFSADGKLTGTWGRKGGRTWAGKYDTSSLLLPAGIAATAKNTILLAETALPKVFSHFTSTGKLINRWYGPGSYGPAAIPDPDDPLSLYYNLSNDDFAKGTITSVSQSAPPTGYWNLRKAGFTAANGLGLYANYVVPLVFKGVNGKKYFMGDGNPHGLALVTKDHILPIGYIQVTDKTRLEIWSDKNFDHKVQSGELKRITPLYNGKPLSFAYYTSSQWMAPNGDVYLMTDNNCIYKIPANELDKNGVISWNTEKAFVVVPEVYPGLQEMPTTWREGLLGVRTDHKGNIYTVFNTSAPTVSARPKPFTYYTPSMAKRMMEGLGHTSRFNVVKIAKFSPGGSLIWMAGRKATAAAKPGEMYHFWTIGGTIGKGKHEYVSGASEWGMVYFYTADGFFVDAIMNNPALTPPPGPYTFGSETFGGRVQEFPERGEVWAYSGQSAYFVKGFINGRVEGEQRFEGMVNLNREYKTDETLGKEAADLRISPVKNDFGKTGIWSLPDSTVLMKDKQLLASVGLAYNKTSLFVHFHVNDPTPLQNTADNLNKIFKDGDAVGLRLGALNKPEKDAGDVRILAADISTAGQPKKPRLVAFKSFTKMQKKEEYYSTPAAGTSRFEFLGEIPGSTVQLIPDSDNKGYTALMVIPLSFLEFNFIPGTEIAADAEVLLSGQGARGFQTVSRNFLFSPLQYQTSMTDDTVVESRLYKDLWGTARIIK